MFANAYKNSPSRASASVSLPNDENVVNPPKTPTTNNARNSGVNKPRVSARYDNTPITKQPMIFTANVPNGKLMLRVASCT